MKALTIKQPWLALLLSGEKPCEYRSWTTPYRGRIYLHAGAARATGHAIRSLFPDAPVGALVATALLDGVYRLTESDVGVLTTPYETPLAAEYAWWFSAIEILPAPLPWRGQLGLWSLPMGIEPSLSGWTPAVQPLHQTGRKRVDAGAHSGR